MLKQRLPLSALRKPLTNFDFLWIDTCIIFSTVDSGCLGIVPYYIYYRLFCAVLEVSWSKFKVAARLD